LIGHCVSPQPWREIDAHERNITFLSKGVLLLNQNSMQNIFRPHFYHFG